MRHLFILLALATLTVGCGKTDPSKAVVAATENRPAMEDAKSSIKEFLAQCGMENVEVTQLADSDVPNAGKTASHSWAYTFNAEYKNVLGETTKSENWVAVVGLEDGKPLVRSCWDEGKQMVGGHVGHVETPHAELLPLGKPN